MNATHITATTSWTPIFHRLISPAGCAYLLSAFDPAADAVGIIYLYRQQTRVRRLNVNDGAAAGPVLDRAHGRPPSNPVDLGALPILASK